jgi:hypothetical protein
VGKTTLNRVDEGTRARIMQRMRELAAEGLTQGQAADVLGDEFPHVKVSHDTIKNIAPKEGVRFLGTAAHDRDRKSTPPKGAADITPEEWDRKAREYLGKYTRLAPVPKQIQATKLHDMGFDTPQKAVALFSDFHRDSKIDRRVSGGMAEYSTEIARRRLTRWRDIVLRFTQMSQVTLDLKELYLFALGDDMEGHGKMFGTQAFMLDDTLFFSYMGFVEDMTEVILSLLQRYEKITILKVYGNHGRVAASYKDWYGPDNVELMAWEHIADRVRSEVGGEWSYSKNGAHLLTGGRVDFCISRSWYIMLDLDGWLFYARHGHGIGDLKRTYTGAYDNKLRMNSITGRVINYMLKAHLHEAQEAESEIAGSVIQNGCFVGPSILSVERNAAAANLPSQEFYLFHPKYGLTHHHRIHLAAVDEIRQLEIFTQTPTGLLPFDWRGEPGELFPEGPSV